MKRVSCYLLPVLCSLFFFLSCENPLSTENDPPPIPAGKGSFSLTLSGVGRTILPDTPSLNDFAVYNLSFTPTSGGSAEEADRTNETLSTVPISLAPGTYNLVVNAYKDTDKNNLAARGTLNDIIINPGKNTSAPVTLKALLSEGTGTFRWDIILPVDVTAYMTIIPPEAMLLTSPAAGCCILNSGPYSVTFNLEKSDGQSVEWNELLYVYQNLESVFTFTFTDAHLSGSNYTVTYRYHDGLTGDQTQSVLHGAQAPAPAIPSRTGYAFSGWYTDDNTFNNKWNFDTPVIDSFTLYAGWIEKDSNTPAVYFDANGGTGAGPSPIIVTAGSSVTIPDSGSLTRSGRVFGGWNTNANGTGTSYYPGASYTPAADITLYARWDILLTNKVWANGSIDSSIAGSGVWYSFPVTSGTTYYLWWNDNKQGNTNSFSLDVSVSAVYSDGTSIFTNIDSGYTSPRQFTADASGTVHVRVAPYTSGNTGTFAVVYSTDNVRPATCTVSFDSNSGSGTLPSQTVQYDSRITLPGGNGLSRSGYIFAGWNTNAGGTGTNYNAGESYLPAADITLYAKWNPAYTVSFNINGATSGSAPAAQTVVVGSSITLPSGIGLTKTGYTFAGWNIDAAGTGTNYNAGESYTPTKNITLYARWLAYTVTFSINGGTGTTPTVQTVAAGSSITLPNGNGLSKNGFTFGGWNTNVAGTGTNYNAGESYTPTANITLYARWLNNYTVTFNMNGAVNGSPPAAQSVSPGNGITLPDQTGMYKGGYSLVGWNTQADGTGASYRIGELYTPTASITLYAMWSINYTVTFSIDGGSGTAPASMGTAAGLSIRLPDGSGLSRSGYVFGGWNNLNAGISYFAGESYTLGSSNVTLYAKWDALLTENSWADGNILYPTTLSSNMWYSFNVTSGTTYYVWWNDSKDGKSDKTLDVKISAFYHDGSSILADGDSGYTSSSSFTANRDGLVHIKVAPYSSGSTGTFALVYSTGSVRPAAYTVRYDNNGGSGAIPSQTVQPGSGIYLPSGNGLTKNGHVFVSWNSDADGTGTNYFTYFAPTDDTTLYARWNPAYTVSFDLNGGSGTTPSPQLVAVGSNATLPSSATRAGYTFAGWNTLADGTGNSYTYSSFTPTSDITLYAKWTCTVTFDINGAVYGSAPAAQTVVAGHNIILPNFSGALSNPNYIFEGWNTRADGTGTTYIAGASYTPSGNTTLYIKWHVCYVTFSVNGGTGTAPATLTVATGSNITLPSGTGLTKTGYTFDGWNTNAAGTGTNYNVGASYTVNSTVTLYAKWATNYTVTFNSNGATSGSAPAAQTVIAGSSITVPGAGSMSKTGYTFANWNTNAAGTGVIWVPGDSYRPTGNITLYAVWTQNPVLPYYTVTFSINGATSGATPTAQAVQGVQNITLPYGNDLVKGGNTFDGWNTNAAGTGTNYRPGATYTVSASVTLYAKWIPASTLTNDRWLTITGNGNTNESLLTFNVVSGTAYKVWWNDSKQGDGTKTLNVYVSAYYYDDNTSIFTEIDSGWDNPQQFVANRTGRVIIKARWSANPNGTYPSGNFAVAYKIPVGGNEGRPTN